MNLSKLFSMYLLNPSMLAEVADASASCPHQGSLLRLQQVEGEGGRTEGCEFRHLNVGVKSVQDVIKFHQLTKKYQSSDRELIGG